MSDIVTKEQELGKIVGPYADLIELPSIIDKQVEQIEALGKRIKEALDAAEEAKNVADEAENIPIKIGHRKKALRKAIEVGQKSTNALSKTNDVLKLSIEYEEQLGKISQKILEIAACSAVHTDRTIERINIAIQNRPANNPLNDVAKKQLQQIIEQMKVQGDTIKKQEALAREMKEKDATDEEQSKQIKEMAADDDRQDALIEEMQIKIDNLEKWKMATLIVSGLALVLLLMHVIGII